VTKNNRKEYAISLGKIRTGVIAINGKELAGETCVAQVSESEYNASAGNRAFGARETCMDRLERLEAESSEALLKSDSEKNTIEIGERLGGLVPAGTTISLEGGLGVGKTVLAKGLCSGLGVSEEVLSPSFILVEEYKGVLPVFHFDLYRLEKVREIDDLGLYDAIDGRNVVVIEWGDRLPEGLIAIDVRVTMKILDSEIREIRISASENLLTALTNDES
jgi:tRNA threonylcarbamoyladenosine biosynthesis protein TsaE